MSNNSTIIVIAGVAVASYFIFDKFQNKVKGIFKSIVPEPLRNVFGGGNAPSGIDYSKLKLLSSMVSRDNVYSTPAVSRGEIVFPELLAEIDAKVKASQVIAANTRIFSDDVKDNVLAWGINIVGIEIDRPHDILDMFLSIENLSQLMQVAYWYNRATGKLLSDGILWIPETMIKQIYDKVNSLDSHTGAEWHNTGNELTFPEFRDLLNGKYKK